MTIRIPPTRIVIQTLILMQEDITVDELQTELANLDLSPTRFAVERVRISFLAVLKLLRSHSLVRDKPIPAPLWLKHHRKKRKRNGRQPTLEPKPKRQVSHPVTSFSTRPFRKWDLD